MDNGAEVLDASVNECLLFEDGNGGLGSVQTVLIGLENRLARGLGYLCIGTMDSSVHWVTLIRF